DYLHFLINTSEVEKVIPSYIQQTFRAECSFLFIGYSLEDMSFKVLSRKLAEKISADVGGGPRHVSVQLLDKGLSDEQKGKRRVYLNNLFGLSTKIYWGSAEEFAADLRPRWEQFRSHPDNNWIVK